MSGLPLLFKKEGLIERHQVEGIDPSDRYFNRAILVNRVAAGYTGKVTYEAYAVEGSAHPTTSAAVKAVVAELGASGMKDMGRVMGEANKRWAGQADGSAIAALVKKLLAGG